MVTADERVRPCPCAATRARPSGPAIDWPWPWRRGVTSGRCRRPPPVLVQHLGPLGTHGFEVALQAGLERAFPVDPPRFFPTVPHGFADPAVGVADLTAAGFAVEEEQELTLQGRAASTADLATGYLTGTPVRAAVKERGDGPAVRATVIEEMTARLGPGPVTTPMTAYVFRAAA
ncbi:hypothetical protein [Streptomyces sp. NPDC001137]|uniref:hypothetical protein n=1 Tax=Streptomyces sp. NPDC001137 TaxID=3154378 RepID=UPI00331F3ACB